MSPMMKRLRQETASKLRLVRLERMSPRRRRSEAPAIILGCIVCSAVLFFVAWVLS